MASLDSSSDVDFAAFEDVGFPVDFFDAVPDDFAVVLEVPEVLEATRGAEVALLDAEADFVCDVFAAVAAVVFLVVVAAGFAVVLALFAGLGLMFFGSLLSRTEV